MKSTTAAIIGAGLCGNLLAICLARRGLQVEVIERRPQPVRGHAGGGRSINLALAQRGLYALQRFDALTPVRSLLLPMRGRMIHETAAEPRFVPYGSAQECIYSVSRATLNRSLYEIAAAQGVTYRFGSECTGLDAATRRPVVVADGRETLLDAAVVFAADGAGSAVRRSLMAAGLVTGEESLLEHGYKELSIAPIRSDSTDDESRAFALEPHALHIWPRSEFMLIALPNTDRSFTATLFLSKHGSPGFNQIGAREIEAFFAAQFADARTLVRDLTGQYARNAVGDLGTVRCAPWHCDHCLLIGDAAHAIVPFHGQGMNAAFEDVTELDKLLDEHADKPIDWPALFTRFEARRIENANAIADMALENYVEMRDSVRDPRFLLQRRLELELERRFPNRFVSRYAMVMFRPDIPYATAQKLGARQARLLVELTADAKRLADVDFDRAAALIHAL